jgi:carboxymethylenebutenolidase
MSAARTTGTKVRLTASDGFALDAYVARPATRPRGALVVVQEIFGVNAHIRSVCDGYARDGYVAIAPAVFDRIERGVDLGYDTAGVEAGRALRAKTDTAHALADIDAARAFVAGEGRVGVVGYCWGGLLAWLAACRLDGFAAAIVYYGGGIGDALGETPRCPVIGHFGERDKMIPQAWIDEWRRRHPSHPVHTYDADHGFNCDARPMFDAGAAKLARERTLAFVAEHVGKA